MQSYWPCHWADLKPKHSTPFYQILRQHDSAPWNGGWLSSNHHHLLQVFNLYIRHNECDDFEVERFAAAAAVLSLFIFFFFPALLLCLRRAIIF